jgi:hypothetical protein
MTLGGSPLTSAAATAAGPPSSQNGEGETKLELSFEYLVAADKLVWITVVSSQAILMSLCLQSMVEELVRIRAGEKDPRRLTRCAAKQRSQVFVINFLTLLSTVVIFENYYGNLFRVSCKYVFTNLI